MVRLWRMYQGGEMGGGHLPEAGGPMDQASAMMEAFAVMDAIEAELRPRRQP